MVWLSIIWSVPGHKYEFDVCLFYYRFQVYCQDSSFLYKNVCLSSFVAKLCLRQPKAMYLNQKNVNFFFFFFTIKLGFVELVLMTRSLKILQQWTSRISWAYVIANFHKGFKKKIYILYCFYISRNFYISIMFIEYKFCRYMFW